MKNNFGRRIEKVFLYTFTQKRLKQAVAFLKTGQMEARLTNDMLRALDICANHVILASKDGKVKVDHRPWTFGTKQKAPGKNYYFSVLKIDNRQKQIHAIIFVAFIPACIKFVYEKQGRVKHIDHGKFREGEILSNALDNLEYQDFEKCQGRIDSPTQEIAPMTNSSVIELTCVMKKVLKIPNEYSVHVTDAGQVKVSGRPFTFGTVENRNGNHSYSLVKILDRKYHVHKLVYVGFHPEVVPLLAENRGAVIFELPLQFRVGNVLRNYLCDLQFVTTKPRTHGMHVT